MRKVIVLIGAALVVCSVNGCAINKRRLMTIQLIAMRNEISDVLSKINDADTAKAWKTKVKHLTDREKEAKDGLAKEDQLTKAESEVYLQDFGDDIEYVTRRYSAELARVQAIPDAWEVIREHFSGLNPSAKDFKMDPIIKREGGQGGGPPKDMPGPPQGGPMPPK
jgi:hypothetical protein